MYSTSQAPQQHQRFGNFGTAEPHSVDTIYLNAIPNVHAPTVRSFNDLCPPDLRAQCPEIIEMLRHVLFQGATTVPQGQPSPFIYFLNVYAAGNWNNQMFDGLTNMFMSVISFLYDNSTAELKIPVIAGDVIQAHILSKFQTDINGWIYHSFPNDYNALINCAQYVDWVEREVKPYIQRKLQAPQQSAQPYSPYGGQHQQQNAYRPNSQPMNQAPAGGYNAYQHQQQAAPAPQVHTLPDSASQLNGNPMESLVHVTKPKADAPQAYHQQPQAQQQPAKVTDSAWDAGDFDNDVRIVAVEGNFAGYQPGQQVAYLSWEDYDRQSKEAAEKLAHAAVKVRRLHLSLEDEGAAIAKLVKEYQLAVRGLGQRYMATLYVDSHKPIGTNQKPHGTKNLAELIEAVFGRHSNDIIDYDLCKAVVIDNRETLLLPSTHQLIRERVNEWRLAYPFTHNLAADFGAREDHYYRLMQYPNIETVFVEDVYIMSEEIMSKNDLFSEALHLPAHTVKPSPAALQRNAAVLQQKPAPVILDDASHADVDFNVIINQNAVVASTAQAAIAAAQASDVLSGEVVSLESGWEEDNIEVVQYNSPNWFLFSHEEDRAWYSARCQEILDGNLTQIDTLAGRMRSAARTRQISKPFYDFLNKYLGRKLSTLVNHELCFRTAIFEEGFVEEWDWVKKNVLEGNSLPGFVKAAWAQSESVWLSTAFTALSVERQEMYPMAAACQIDTYLPYITAQIPTIKSMETNSLLIPTDDLPEVEDFLLATWAGKNADELAALTEAERTQLEIDYHASQTAAGAMNLSAVDLDINDMAVLVDRFCVYQIPFNHDELGLEPTYVGSTQRIANGASLMTSPRFRKLDQLLREHAQSELSGRVQQQLYTRDGYVLDVVRSICNPDAFTLVLRDA